MSKLVNTLCEIFDITQHNTSAYHPKTNGLVERQNSTLAQSLRAYCGDAQDKWPNLISNILMAYRKSPSQHFTEFSPYVLVFGEEMNLPYDVALDPLESMARDARAYIREFLDNMRAFDKIAEENIAWHQKQNKIKHDFNSNTPNFQLGDQVLIKINKVPKWLSSKLYDKSDGPYRIVEVGPNFTYKLRRCSDNKLHGSMMNASNLKRNYDPEVTRPTFHTPGQGQDMIQVQQDEVDNNDTDTEQDEGLGQLFNDQNVAVNGPPTGSQNESTDSGQRSDEAIYDPQKK